MNTRFLLRRKIFGNLKSVEHASRSHKPTASGAETGPGGSVAAIDPPTQREPIPIDSLMFGETELMAAHLLAGERPALVDPGPANTVANVIAELEAMGVGELDSIVLTHIHFDHAAGTGRLASRFPEATVYVHSRVAEHLVDPSRLIAGVKSVWGEKTEDLFGLPAPVEPDRIVSLEDGDRIDLGDRSLESVATPGHTRAHMSFLDSETGALFCGDSIGLQLPGSSVIRPSTPPSDFSKSDALASIQRLKQTEAQSLHLPHFGEARPSPEQTLDRAEETLTRWHETFARQRETSDGELDLQRKLNACVEATLEPVTPVTRRSFEAVNPVWLNIAGMTAEAQRTAKAPSR